MAELLKLILQVNWKFLWFVPTFSINYDLDIEILQVRARAVTSLAPTAAHYLKRNLSRKPREKPWTWTWEGRLGVASGVTRLTHFRVKDDTNRDARNS